MPKLEDIPENLHFEVTREARSGKLAQTVKDIAAKVAGRVPANLGKLFRDLEKFWSLNVIW